MADATVSCPVPGPVELSDPTLFTRPTNCPLGLGFLGHRGVVDAPASIPPRTVQVLME